MWILVTAATMTPSVKSSRKEELAQMKNLTTEMERLTEESKENASNKNIYIYTHTYIHIKIE